MRVSLSVGNSRCEARILTLHALGAVLECELPDTSGPAELRLEEEDLRLELPGEILRRSEEGLCLAFGQLGLDELEDLDRLRRRLAGEQAPAGPAPASSPPPGEGQRISLQPGWTPPLSEPRPQEWQPPGKLVPPLPEEYPATRAWADLSTRAAASPPPPPAAPVAAARPAPKPAQPTGAERRVLKREERSIPLVFDNLTSLIKEFTHNISFGGLFLFTERPHRAGEEVAVTLVHPVSGERLTLLGRVAHASGAPAADPVSGKSRYGVGVQFRLPLDELKRVLSDFIDSRQRPQPGIDRLMAEARRRLGEADKGPRTLLGVDAEADEPRIRRAYFELVDRFHPDRYCEKVPAPDRALLEELFRRLTAAYESLLS